MGLYKVRLISGWVLIKKFTVFPSLVDSIWRHVPQFLITVEPLPPPPLLWPPHWYGHLIIMANIFLSQQNDHTFSH